MYLSFEFQQAVLEQQQMTHYFDAAARGAGAAAHEHQPENDKPQCARPEQVIGRNKPCGGDDGNHRENRIPESGFRMHLVNNDERHGNDQCGDQNDKDKIFEFLILADVFELSVQCKVVEGEIGACQNHKNGDDILNVWGKSGNTGVPCGKSAGGHGAESMTQPVEKVHPAEHQQSCFHNGQHNVDAPQPFGCCGNSGMQLVGRGPGNLRNEQLHAADTEKRENGQRQHNDAHASDPVCHRPPEQQSLWYAFNVIEDRRPCGCKA